MSNYSKLDEKIDKYLGTYNLRPGPAKRTINKYINKEQDNNHSKFDSTKKINLHSSFSAKISKESLKWTE